MKKVLLTVLFLLILTAVPLTVFLVKQQQDIRQRAVEASRIYIDPATLTKNIDDTFTVDVKLDTQTDNVTNQVYGADVTLIFDPAYLNAVSIDNGSFFSQVISGSGTVDNQAGTAHITLGVDQSQTNGISGVGQTVATATFKAKANTTTAPASIQFSTDTIVSGKENGVAKDELVARVGSQITIGATTGASPSPSGIASPNPSATPNSTPIASPSLLPSATPANQTTTIDIPANGATLTSARPTFSGKSFANASMILTINTSAVISSSFVASPTGSWTFTPTVDIPNGTYSVTVSGENTSGTLENATASFTVSSAGTGGTGIASPVPTATPFSTPGSSPLASAASSSSSATNSAIPVTGTTTPTFIVMGLAIFLLIIGGMSALL